MFYHNSHISTYKHKMSLPELNKKLKKHQILKLSKGNKPRNMSPKRAKKILENTVVSP